MASKTKLDKVDRKVINLLRKNGRMSVSDISREIENLTESAIRYRIERLEKEGVINKYTILLDPKKLGKNYQVIFNLKVLPENMETAIQYLNKVENLTSVYLTTGTYSVISIGHFATQKEITEFITTKLKDVPLIDYDIAQVLRKEKATYYWA